MEGGGAERQLRMLATEQAKRARNVHIAVRRATSRENGLCGAGVALHVLGDHRGASPFLLAGIVRLVRRLKPQVIQTWLPQMDVLGGAAALSNDTPWIIAERSSSLAFQGMQWWSWVRPRLGRRASAIVANSSGGTAYWRQTARVNSFMEVVPNAVDAEAIRNAPAASLPAGCTPGGYLLVVGRLGPEKRVACIIKAFGTIAARCDLNLLIVGEGPLQPQLQAQIAAAGLHRRVFLVPYQQRWWGLLPQAKALLSMSLFEGQPNVVLEAMAARCPVLVSDIPAHREILDDASALFVRPEDDASLAQAIEQVIADEESARRRAERASRSIENRTVQAMADAYDNVYQRAMRGSAR
jgi:glycosyltransferase involved in cell wall biosynthesis